ncbi:HTTM domain-containing protein [Paeniglutamicibacter sp. ABSL32-1]|uniref:HTTM domain-containing protein n=1 Tax=Paeniglutamicibacter quisquiliarum TaxID=2849498 RepID=UPI001C2CFB67|nr:HTTM domain-containing protein [Paeniglutamicibacter quisquiliarum]MBV1778158.1 HTTM domain-containing protein [Paeniglutamicibacter quisquiliarum]
MILASCALTVPSLTWSREAIWVDAARRKRGIEKGNVLTRLWHGAPVFPQALVNMAHNLVVVTLTCQVVFIYVSGALYKAGGKPWQDGTAVYAPLHVTRFAPWPELSEIATAWAPAVAAMSIGSVLIQLFFPGALLFRWTRIPILFAMIGFHAGIGLLMGLPWFSLSMVAIDSIFVRDVTWQRIENWFKKAMREQPEALPEFVDMVHPTEKSSELRESTHSESTSLLDAGRR